MTLPAIASLSGLVRHAADALSRAATSAEVLEAREMAGVAYDTAKRAARFARAKAAHDDLVAAAHRAEADALEIESLAKRRLADEYDAAQERGEVARHGGKRRFNVPDANVEPTAADLGLSRREIHDSREVRDALARDPGIVRRALDELLATGDEPTRAAVRRSFDHARANLRAAVGTDSASAAERGNNLYETPAEAISTLLALESFGPRVKEPACGKGAILRPLEAAGYDVEISDLVDYGTATVHGELQRVEDFLASEPAEPREAERPDIVTNPPYGAALNAFVARALRVHRPRKMALLLNLNFLCGFDDEDRRFAMDDNPPARVLVFTRRLPMMHRDGWDGAEASSRMNCAWFVWEQDAFGAYAGPTIVRRVDWADFAEAPALAPGVPSLVDKTPPPSPSATPPPRSGVADGRSSTAAVSLRPSSTPSGGGGGEGAARDGGGVFAEVYGARSFPAEAPPAPLLVWEQQTAVGRIVAKLGRTEVGAVFPDEAGCVWSYWLGVPHGPKSRAKSVAAGKKAIEKRFLERTGLT